MAISLSPFRTEIRGRLVGLIYVYTVDAFVLRSHMPRGSPAEPSGVPPQLGQAESIEHGLVTIRGHLSCQFTHVHTVVALKPYHMGESTRLMTVK